MLAGPRPVRAVSRFFLESAERWDLIPAPLIRERPKVSTLESGFQQPEIRMIISVERKGAIEQNQIRMARRT
jgi:hypothetical protein